MSIMTFSTYEATQQFIPYSSVIEIEIVSGRQEQRRVQVSEEGERRRSKVQEELDTLLGVDRPEGEDSEDGEDGDAPAGE